MAAEDEVPAQLLSPNYYRLVPEAAEQEPAPKLPSRAQVQASIGAKLKQPSMAYSYEKTMARGGAMPGGLVSDQQRAAQAAEQQVPSESAPQPDSDDLLTRTAEYEQPEFWQQYRAAQEYGARNATAPPGPSPEDIAGAEARMQTGSVQERQAAARASLGLKMRLLRGK